MENNAELHRLEELVDQLLKKYTELKGDYHALEEMLAERDTECAELKGTIENLNDEKASVSSRVSGLLDRITQWEAEQAGDDAHNDGQGGMQGSLFESDEQHQEHNG
ncbi:MAG: hypothetical protein CSB34_01035 [Desulfobulbus propionicus]|nr:MAG: hypothetical protein CSB34_01035 [Desulfobulbus propionicus]PIE64055.1 MAG: hypothetical protein CSA26_10020 [Desulfobacterales bacterium]